MTGFVAIAPVSTAPVPDLVAGDEWWPDLSVADARVTLRLSGSVTDARLRDALVGGMLSAIVELRDWQAAQLAAGAASIDESVVAPPVELGGVHRARLLFVRAAHAYAAADLAETHATVSATRDGRDRAEGEAIGADDHRRTATLAVRDLLGRRRSRVSLR